MSPHGIPLDLLDRLLIIRTNPYTADEIGRIINVRAKTEGLVLSPAAVAKMAEIGAQTSLRYVMQLLTPAAIQADMSGRPQIEEEDVEEVFDIFLDFRRSTQQLKMYSDKYLK